MMRGWSVPAGVAGRAELYGRGDAARIGEGSGADPGDLGGAAGVAGDIRLVLSAHEIVRGGIEGVDRWIEPEGAFECHQAARGVGLGNQGVEAGFAEVGRTVRPGS